MELWDLYTEDRVKTTTTQIRGERIPEGYYHLVVHVWIRNSKGEYLISQRAANRPTFPLMWECVGGSVLAGENSIDGAIREAHEEVGVTLDPIKGRILFSKIRKSFQDIVDVWLFEYDGDPHLEQATTDEVADCLWMSAGAIKELYGSGKLVNTLGYFFSGFADDVGNDSSKIRTTTR